MTSNNPLALIDKLTGRENYTTWKFAVKTYLQHEELWECIENSRVIDEKRDTKAKAKIVLLVDPINYVHIQEARTAKEAWDNLSRAFDDSGLTRRVGLLRDLCTTTLDRCQNVEEYVSKIITTAHKLRNIGFSVDDEWLGTLLLSGLPESYKPMIIAIESSGMQISADSVKSKILQDVREESNPTTTAFATNQRFQNNKSNKGPRCYTCNNYGHKSFECRKSKKKDNSQKKNNSSYAAVFIATSNHDDAWYIDSGASSHMTKHKNLLQNEKSSSIKNIKVANNKILPVVSSGELSLSVSSDRGLENKILFRDVLYVPELATNLLSVSQIINNGGQVIFNNKGCVILNSQNKKVATASLINNMYRLNTPKSYACMSDVNEQDTYLWHQRMGHLNFNSLEKMSESTEGVCLSEKKVSVACVTCKEGKQTRLPFQSQSSKSNHLLELIHSDVCGPMETKSLGGSRYFLTFLDDYSKKIFVYFLQNKSQVLEKNETWTLVEKPSDAKVIGCKWVFRVKDEPTGPRFKSRLCAKGYAQTEGIDYKETFAPTVRYDSIRLLLSLAVEYNLEIIQLDVKTAFLYGELEENIFMSPPDGLTCNRNMVCKLNKSLYGLKQAPRCWNNKFNSVLKKFGFINSKADQCVYVGYINGTKCYLCLYVDDGLLFSTNKSALKEFISDLQTIFEIKISSVSNFVGMQIEKCDKYIFIHQSKYIHQLLNKFNMINANPNSVPVDPHVKLEKGECSADKNIPYREAVGALMHLAIVSRPDIMFAVSLVSRFLNCYNESHWNAVKKIFKYLKETQKYGLRYLSSADHKVLGYCDADYANDVDTRRSVTGYVFIKSGAAVTWSSQRQQSVALSTTEAEFMAACAATKEAIWIKQMLSDIGEYKQETLCLNLDNQSAISVIRNANFHKRCKHIDIKYHFVKEKYYSKIIDLKYVSSNDQYADILTKALCRDKFKFLIRKIGIDSNT